MPLGGLALPFFPPPSIAAPPRPPYTLWDSSFLHLSQSASIWGKKKKESVVKCITWHIFGSWFPYFLIQMSSVESKIKDAAARNSALLRELADTDYALPALEQQRRYIDDLQKEAADLQTRIQELDKKRQKEFREHKAYRDSVMRRFAYKVGGRGEEFNQRAAKEEQDYFQALQEEHQAKKIRDATHAMISEALMRRNHLENELVRHRDARLQLDSLYDYIFQGPTPGFPEEDHWEKASAQVLEEYHNTRIKVEAEDKVIKLLASAQDMMREAVFNMRAAQRNSRADMLGGGTFNDMMERNALSAAAFNVSSARMLVAQGRRISPLVRNLPPVNIAQGNLMSDVFFDNIYTDMAFHAKIKESSAEVRRCAAELEVDLEAAQERRRVSSEILTDKETKLEESRVALQKIREAAFERVTGQPDPGGPE